MISNFLSTTVNQCYVFTMSLDHVQVVFIDEMNNECVQ